MRNGHSKLTTIATNIESSKVEKDSHYYLLKWNYIQVLLCSVVIILHPFLFCDHLCPNSCTLFNKLHIWLSRYLPDQDSFCYISASLTRYVTFVFPFLGLILLINCLSSTAISIPRFHLFQLHKSSTSFKHAFSTSSFLFYAEWLGCPSC